MILDLTLPIHPPMGGVSPQIINLRIELSRLGQDLLNF